MIPSLRCSILKLIPAIPLLGHAADLPHERHELGRTIVENPVPLSDGGKPIAALFE